MRRLRGIHLFCATVVAVASVAGCSEDPGLQERVNRLQAEMQEKDRQLQDAQASLERTKSELKSARAASATKPATEAPTPGASPALLSRERVEESYATASKAMQKHLASELKNYSVENCAEFPVVMPSDEHPYFSKIVVTFRSDAGRSYRLEFPVSADADGKWVFPSSSDVAGVLADSRSQDVNNTATSPTASRVTQNGTAPTPGNRPSGQNTSAVVPGQTSTETRVIDWGDGRATNNNRPDRAPTPAKANSSPTGTSTPAPAMQADKDIRIHW